MNAAVMEVRAPSVRYLARAEPALLRGFEMLSTDIGGAAKLRKLIFSLAVQGRIVSQVVGDGSATQALKRLGAIDAYSHATARAEAQGELFPNGWAAVMLAHLGRWAIGSGFAIVEQGKENLPILFAKVSDMNRPGNERVIVSTAHTIDDDIARRIRVNIHPAGTVVFPKIGGAIATNKRRILVRPTAIDNNCLGITPGPWCSTEYLHLLLTSIDFTVYQVGTSVPALSQGTLGQIPVGLPPLAEQHRIVARVEELMKLCDALEQSGRLAEEQHARLTATLFDALAASESAHALAENWQRIAEHFDLLLDRPETVDALEQTVLQLAVRGLLVSQDASEGTGDDLLERHVRAARTSGKRARTELLPLTQEDGPFIIPPAWAWTRFGEVADVSGGVTLGRKGALAQPVTLPYLRVASVQRGKLNLSAEVKTVAIDTAELPRFQLKFGDLLITEGGDWDKVGRTCIWREEIATCLHQNHVFKARGHTSEWLPAWGELYLNSADARAYFAASAKQTTNLASINMTELRNCMFPLPPVAEQQRILARVEELRSLCAQLRKRLTAAWQTQALLADVLVAQTASA